MKRLGMKIGCFLLAILLSGLTVTAAENTKIMKVQDKNSNPVIFVKGIEGEVQEASAVIGNVEALKVEYANLNQESVMIKTLILVDNSLSIPENKRDSIREVVQELLAGRADGEEYAIATFGESVEMLCEFTNDYLHLKEVLDGIEFKDRETYLTDVLYEIIDEGMLDDGDVPVYSRIFVVSDGVDNKSLGYTSQELNILLEEKKTPIYSLGIYNRSKSNDNELKEMFALSRLTNGDFFLLDELEDTISVVSVLAGDSRIVVFTVTPASESKDGSEKTVSLRIKTADSETEVQVDNVRMVQEVKEQEIVIEHKEPAQELIPNTETVEPVEGTNNDSILKVGIIAIAAFFVILIAIIIIVVAVKKRKAKAKVVEVEDPFQTLGSQDDKTEMIANNSLDYDDSSGGETIHLFDNNSSFYITLTDVDVPSKSFRKSINDRLVIGRSQSRSDICIDYDQSVSGRHCEIERRGNRFYLIDLQSKNKTYLNDNQVLSEVEIYSGSIIRLGRVKLRVEMS